jgi:hypothetical protein
MLVRKSVQLLLADDITAMFMTYMQHGEGHLPFALMFSEVYRGMLCQWKVKAIKKYFMSQNLFSGFLTSDFLI